MTHFKGHSIRRWTGKSRCFLAACLFFLSCTHSDAQERPIGFVLDLVGHWKLNGNSLKKSQGVPAGGTIQFAGTTGERSIASLTIILLDNKSVYLSCAIPGACDKGYRLPAGLLETPSLIKRLMEATLTLFGRRPERYVPMLVRTGEGGQLPEMVMGLSDGQVRLNPLLSSLAAGRYRLRLTNLLQSLPEAGSGSTLEFLWDPRNPPEVQSGRIAEGLYQVELTALPWSFEKSEPLACWVLILPADRYPRIAQEYELLRSGQSQWDPMIPLPIRRTFLRACLECLAGESQ